MNRALVLIVLGISVACGQAFAQPTPDPKATLPVVPAPESDSTNYLADTIDLPFARQVRKIDLRNTSKKPEPRCAPQGTDLRGVGRVKLEDGEYPAFMVRELSKSAERRNTCDGSDLKVVAVGDVVAIASDDLIALPPERFGATYGTLLIPFKYQLKGDKSFSGRSSLGGYFGYRADRTPITGLSGQFVVFLGGTALPVVSTVDGKAETQEIAGLTYGVGILGRVKQNFQLGFVLGADRASKSSSYVNNGKPWVAVSLGFAFSN